ncbi:MAG: 3'-5' exonuclease, partial [Minisyncoccota bacterium]
AVFCAYNVSFDWSFIVEAFHKTNIPNPMSTRENHDRLDILSIAWLKGMKDKPSFSLKNACIHFGVEPEPAPHTALAGAETAYRLFKKLMS